ncbi:MAG: DNA polymerase III subunit beta [Deltaproteobacteria bacterium]|nr:DNA polymerase III subunit beta [Deltaproteobacteria bacterium]
MKFTVKKGLFLDVMSKIQGITSRKSSLSITETVLIDARGSNISLSATDLETGFLGAYPANVETDGSIALNSKKLFEIIRDFPSEEICFNEIEEAWIEIGNEQVQYHIVGMNPEDFPEIPKIETVGHFQINAIHFSRMIEKATSIPAPSDDKRAHINGIYFEPIKTKNDWLKMVSTDGSRLITVECRLDHPMPSPFETGVLVPKKGLSEVKKFLDPDGSVEICFQHNNFIVKNKSETIIIRLLEGNFPEYSEIVDKEGCHSTAINRALFLMMLKRMSILSSDAYKGVIFYIKPDQLTIMTTNPDIGESKEDMEIEYGGESLEMAFNPRYFIDLMNVIEDDQIIMSLINEERPCFIEGEMDKSFLNVIMPMRL